MNKKYFNISVVIVLVAGGIAALSWWVFPLNKQAGPSLCTQEAKLCPDGSYVGRISPDCEFAQCPAAGSSGITGTILLGPTCPVQRDPPDPQCADKPYATSLVVTTVSGERIIKELTSDSNGEFRVAVPPGEYAIRAAATADTLPRCDEQLVVVRASEYTATTLRCDTGIR